MILTTTRTMSRVLMNSPTMRRRASPQRGSPLPPRHHSRFRQRGQKRTPPKFNFEQKGLRDGLPFLLILYFFQTFHA